MKSLDLGIWSRELEEEYGKDQHHETSLFPRTTSPDSIAREIINLDITLFLNLLAQESLIKTEHKPGSLTNGWTDLKDYYFFGAGIYEPLRIIPHFNNVRYESSNYEIDEDNGTIKVKARIKVSYEANFKIAPNVKEEAVTNALIDSAGIKLEKLLKDHCFTKHEKNPNSTFSPEEEGLPDDPHALQLGENNTFTITGYR